MPDGILTNLHIQIQMAFLMVGRMLGHPSSTSGSMYADDAKGSAP